MISVWNGERLLSEVVASRFRRDLIAAGVGDGCYAFDLSLDERIPNDELSSVRVVIKERDQEIPLRPEAICREESLPDCQINVYTLQALRAAGPKRYSAVRFDPNNTCNLRCVYCHNDRSSETISTKDFDQFLHEYVLGVQLFQVGCIMEPTLDARLTDLMLKVAESPAKPLSAFMLQTNGVLLHRHDYAKMRAAGLTQLSVSMDTADAEMLKSLRSGMSMEKVTRNVAGFIAACPDIAVTFIATVTRENIGTMKNLVTMGMDIGVKDFVFREVFYYPENKIVDHSRMPGLVLMPGQFEAMQESLSKLGDRANLTFADRQCLEASSRKMVDEAHGALQ